MCMRVCVHVCVYCTSLDGFEYFCLCVYPLACMHVHVRVHVHVYAGMYKGIGCDGMSTSSAWSVLCVVYSQQGCSLSCADSAQVCSVGNTPVRPMVCDLITSDLFLSICTTYIQLQNQ